MKRNKKRNIGGFVAAMLLMATMLVTGCGSNATGSNTDRTKANPEGSAQTADSEGAQAETTTVLIDTADTGATEESPTKGPLEAPTRLSANATPEEVEAYLAGGRWEMIYGGWWEGPARSEMLFGADQSVTFRMPMDEGGNSYAEAKGSYSVSYATNESPYPDLLTLSFDHIPDEMTADYNISDEDAPTEDFSFFIACDGVGGCLNLYSTSLDSVIANRLFKEENQTSETWRMKKAGKTVPYYDSGWIFERYTEGASDDSAPPEPKANADFYAMIWADDIGDMAVSYMKMDEKTDVFDTGDHYYCFSNDGAPEIIGYEVNFDVMGDRGEENTPYHFGFRMPCVIAHITTGADAKITSVEYFTFAGSMLWEKWTGELLTDGDDEPVDGAKDEYGNFPGLYEKGPGITCNIWTQSDGIMVGPAFGTGASPYGEAEYRDGKLFFDIIDYDTEFTYQGEIERTADGIRLTITGSDDPEAPIGSVFEMPELDY